MGPRGDGGWANLCSWDNADTGSLESLLAETVRSAGASTSAAGLVPWTAYTSCPRCFSGRKAGGEGTRGAV